MKLPEPEAYCISTANKAAGAAVNQAREDGGTALLPGRGKQVEFLGISVLRIAFVTISCHGFAAGFSTKL